MAIWSGFIMLGQTSPTINLWIKIEQRLFRLDENFVHVNDYLQDLEHSAYKII